MIQPFALELEQPIARSSLRGGAAEIRQGFDDFRTGARPTSPWRRKGIRIAARLFRGPLPGRLAGPLSGRHAVLGRRLPELT